MPKKIIDDPDYHDRRPIPEAAADFIAAVEQRILRLRRRLAVMQGRASVCSCCPERFALMN